jgi:hypothetical protein
MMESKRINREYTLKHVIHFAENQHIDVKCFSK